MNSTQARTELARLSEAAGPVADRATEMLAVVRGLVPFEAAWIARAEPVGYASVAAPDLPPPVLTYMAGPKNAHDIEVTGTNRRQPPLSPSDLPYPVEELPTWAECLLPAGLHEALALALFEPGGRRVGFLALLFGDRTPPTTTERQRVAAVAPLIAHGIDPLRSATAAGRLVAGAFAGVLLLASGGTAPLPGLRDDPLLRRGSSLLDTVRARLLEDETHLSFLWPIGSEQHPSQHVRASWLAVSDPPADPVRGVLLLSPPGELHGLTPRELEVLGMMVDGCSNQQIADRLFVAPRTVAAHIEHILIKLESPSRTHAAVRAHREGLFVPGPECP
jgi:DNA-binding CsgD family transcriptional regulator